MTTEYTTNYQLAKPDFNLFGWHDEINGNSDTLDSILFSLTGFSNFVGAWTNSTNYTEGQRVIDPVDASVWHCQIDHTSAATDTFADDRAANPTYWIPISSLPFDRGEWDTGIVYAIGDIAHSTPDGLFGICNVLHTSTTSMRDDIANWAILFDGQTLTLASNIGFTPTGSIASTNVQDAIAEIASPYGVLLYSASPSAVAAFGFDISGYTAYRMLKIVLTQIVLSSDGTVVAVRIDADADGLSVDVGAADYAYAIMVLDVDVGTVAPSVDDDSNMMNLTGPVEGDSVATAQIELDAYSPHVATNKKFFSWKAVYIGSVNEDLVHATGSGMRNEVADPVRYIQILTSIGTISCNVAVYGMP